LIRHPARRRIIRGSKGPPCSGWPSTVRGYPEQTIEPDLPAKVGAAFNVDSAALAAGEDVTDLLADSLW
jgi:hypothetical protein